MGAVLDRIRAGNVERNLAGIPHSREFRLGPDYAGVHRERQIGIAKQLFAASVSPGLAQFLEMELLVGPQRVEGGWWDGEARAAAADPPPLSRDYWVAHSPRAGLLWVFCTRPVAQQQEPAWYLHGHFA